VSALYRVGLLSLASAACWRRSKQKGKVKKAEGKYVGEIKKEELKIRNYGVIRLLFSACSIGVGITLVDVGPTQQIVQSGAVMIYVIHV
jgi:hypothetical protein